MTGGDDGGSRRRRPGSRSADAPGRRAVTHRLGDPPRGCRLRGTRPRRRGPGTERRGPWCAPVEGLVGPARDLSRRPWISRSLPAFRFGSEGVCMLCMDIRVILLDGQRR